MFAIISWEPLIKIVLDGSTLFFWCKAYLLQRRLRSLSMIGLTVIHFNLKGGSSSCLVDLVWILWIVYLDWFIFRFMWLFIFLPSSSWRVGLENSRFILPHGSFCISNCMFKRCSSFIVLVFITGLIKWGEALKLTNMDEPWKGSFPVGPRKWMVLENQDELCEFKGMTIFV